MIRHVMHWVFAAGLLVGVAGSALAFESLSSAGFALENGDINGDQEIDLSDPVQLLAHLYLGAPEAVPLALCGELATSVRNGDSNGDGTLDVSDAVHLLGWLFVGGPAPRGACGDGVGGARNVNPRIIPPHASPYGKSYGAWSGLWWAWAFSIPAGVNPILDPTGENCDEGELGKVWFLAGSFSSEPTTRSCTVPDHQHRVLDP